MSDQSWTVVRFIDEDTVEAVPSSWILQNRCYWPPFKNEKIMAIILKMNSRIHVGLPTQSVYFETALLVSICSGLVVYLCISHK